MEMSSTSSSRPIRIKRYLRIRTRPVTSFSSRASLSMPTGPCRMSCSSRKSAPYTTINYLSTTSQKRYLALGPDRTIPHGTQPYLEPATLTYFHKTFSPSTLLTSMLLQDKTSLKSWVGSYLGSQFLS